jgi:hypothetical protein
MVGAWGNMAESRGAYRRPEGKKSIGRQKDNKDNIKKNLQEVS